jgi:hypothetical protein
MKNRIIAAVLGVLIMATLFTGCSQIAVAQNTGAAEGTQSGQSVKSVQNINYAEAVNVIKHMINLDYSKFKIDLINDDLKYKGQRYFQFLISDSNAAIEPSIIVSKDDGQIFCYYPDKTTTEVYEDQVFKSKI